MSAIINLTLSSPGENGTIKMNTTWIHYFCSKHKVEG